MSVRMMMTAQDIAALCDRADGHLEILDDHPAVKADLALLTGLVRGSLLKAGSPFELAPLGGLVEVAPPYAPPENGAGTPAQEAGAVTAGGTGGAYHDTGGTGGGDGAAEMPRAAGSY